jgi:hypothetical protein
MDGLGRPSPAGTRTAIRFGVILPNACRCTLAVVANPLVHCPARAVTELPNMSKV